MKNSAKSQPHVAYAAYTHGLSSKWNYLLRITENQLNDILESLEKAVQSHFIPALTGQPPPGEHTRELLALPARLGGLGLMNPAASVKDQMRRGRCQKPPTQSTKPSSTFHRTLSGKGSLHLANTYSTPH